MKVVTIVYGQKREWTSQKDALKFFIECFLSSEGAEADRYKNVLNQLMNDRKICGDQEDLMNYQIGDEVKIIKMLDEPNYSGKIGIIESIDAEGQLHGSWGGCALSLV